MLGHRLGANVRGRRRKVFADYTQEPVDRYGPESPHLSCQLPTPGPCRSDGARGTAPAGTALCGRGRRGPSR